MMNSIAFCGGIWIDQSMLGIGEVWYFSSKAAVFSRNDGFKKLSFPDTPFVGNYFHYPNAEFKHPDQIKNLTEYDINFQTYIMAHNG